MLESPNLLFASDFPPGKRRLDQVDTESGLHLLGTRSFFFLCLCETEAGHALAGLEELARNERLTSLMSGQMKASYLWP
jgi:hypothetical protein